MGKTTIDRLEDLLTKLVTRPDVIWEVRESWIKIRIIIVKENDRHSSLAISFKFLNEINEIVDVLGISAEGKYNYEIIINARD